MQVLINNEPSPLQPEPGETLGHLFMRLEDHFHQEGLTVLSCSLDGHPLDIAGQQAVSDHGIGDHQSLGVEVIETKLLAEKTLGDLKTYLQAIPEEAEAAAATLQAGNYEAASVKINSILQVWAILFDTLTNASKYHKFKLGDLQCDGNNIGVMVSALSELMRELQEAYGNRDTVTVADVLEYEIAPAVPTWIQAVDVVIEHLARQRSDGSAG